MSVITRFAPSPTGYFHAGSYRTALFSWIYAKKNKGRFILRIEDTDKERSKKEYEDNIIDSLKWLGLEYDEFYRQSERGNMYRKYLEKLISSGYAYVSKEDGKDIIRFKNPNKKIIFDDIIRGRIEFDTTELKDFVIAKNFDEPVFHLVVVVDDLEMGVTHIIRGEDHISNTPRHILIYQALGFTPPAYAHIPLLLAKDRSKLSKRNGAIPVSEYRDKGYLKEALINYLALLGWHPADDKEILSLDQIIGEFTLERVQKSGAIFDDDKLKWFNRQYILKLSDDDFIAHAETFLPEWLGSRSPILKPLVPILRDKINAFGEIRDLLSEKGELGFIHGVKDYPADLLLWKKNPDKVMARSNLEEVTRLIEDGLKDTYGPEEVKSVIWPLAEDKGKGEVLWPLRAALTGREKSPDPFAVASILGKKEVLSRIAAAIRKLG